MITIIIIKKNMSNIIQLHIVTNKNSNQHQTDNVNEVNKLYNELIRSGFSSCAAFHEVMKLLLISNPSLELSDLSQKTFKILNPMFDNYFENNIDNHSQN